MKVTLSQTGGYAGTKIDLVSLETERVDSTVARELERLLSESRFFELPSSLPSETIGADLQSYEIAISDGDRTHSVTFVEDQSAASAPLRRLREALTRAGA